MLTTSHAVAGSAIGLGVKSSPFAFFLAVGAHLLMDKIPHFWPESNKYKNIIKIVDAVFSLTFIGYLFVINPHFNNSLAFGALGGASVDYVLVGIPWAHRSKLGQWHSKRQLHHQKNIYWLVDIVFLSVSLMVWMLLR
jgi:hypothetical protein